MSTMTTFLDMLGSYDIHILWMDKNSLFWTVTWFMEVFFFSFTVSHHTCNFKWPILHFTWSNFCCDINFCSFFCLKLIIISYRNTLSYMLVCCFSTWCCRTTTTTKAFKYINVFNFSISTIPQFNCCSAVTEPNSEGKL